MLPSWGFRVLCTQLLLLLLTLPQAGAVAVPPLPRPLLPRLQQASTDAHALLQVQKATQSTLGNSTPVRSLADLYNEALVNGSSETLAASAGVAQEKPPSGTSTPARSMADLYNEALAEHRRAAEAKPHGVWVPLSLEDPLVPHAEWRAPAEAKADFAARAALDEKLANFEAQALASVVSARKFGPHPGLGSGGGQPVLQRAQAFLESGSVFDWTFLAVALTLLGFMDVTILQQLPETARTHVLLLTFWLLVAVAFGVEVWCRLGPQGGVAWISGYLLEVVFSIDNVFVIHLLFCSLETPRRLTQKALFVASLGTLAARPFLLVGMAPALERLCLIPFALGLWFIYCGARCLAARDDESDVTRTLVVRGLRRLLGARLCTFYDEESEAVFVAAKSQVGMSLLGVAMLSLFTASTVLSVDVALAKMEAVPNGYISFSSTAIAMFAVRALFFVARDIFARFGLSKYGVGLVLLFVGVEALMSRIVYVSALVSVAVAVTIMALAAAASCVGDPFLKTLA